MSLIVTLRVNDEDSHAFMVIRRVKGSSKPDSINTYEYLIYHQVWRVARGHVQHRYGAGSLSLLATVCRHAGLEQDLAPLPRQEDTTRKES